jgi:hypothetical protein
MNTYIGHFQLLINVCEGFGMKYNPQSPALQTMAMRSQLSAVQTAVNLVDTLLPDYIAAESARHEKFAIVPPLATRVQAAAVVANLPDAIITRIKEIVRKIHGERAKKIKPEDVAGVGGEPAKHISVSQTSFNEQIEHFNQLIDLAASQTTYMPAEIDLSVTSLSMLLNKLRLTNDAVMFAAVPLTTARQERNTLLYAPKTGMIDTALAVKEYVKAVFGAASPEYKEVNHIKFQNRKI